MMSGSLVFQHAAPGFSSLLSCVELLRSARSVVEFDALVQKAQGLLQAVADTVHEAVCVRWSKVW